MRGIWLLTSIILFKLYYAAQEKSVW
jgi:hypothetical protein